MSKKKKHLQKEILDSYLKKITPLVKELMVKTQSTYPGERTLFSIQSLEALEIAHNVRQHQMKEGELAQILIGNWLGWQNLKRGHSTGLDCHKLDNSVIMELKNSYNTCNSKGEKMLLTVNVSSGIKPLGSLSGSCPEAEVQILFPLKFYN